MSQIQRKNIPDLPAFAEEIRKLVKDPKKLPPVDTWHPEREADIDIMIDANGEWFYQGNKMERLAVVQLLSSILRKEGEEYFLVSPVEKLKLKVVDAPFMVTMMDIEGEGEQQLVHFSTQVGECFTLSPEHALSLKQNQRSETAPYVHVRSGLQAKLNRSVYYELVDRLQTLGSDVPSDRVIRPEGLEEMLEEKLGLWSAGYFFRLS